LRKLWIAVVVGVVLVALSMVVWVFVTMPHAPSRLYAPLTAGQRALLLHVPSSAESFALIGTAGAVYERLAANPITAGPLESWAAQQQMPSPRLALGRADIVAWKSGKTVGYAVRPDPVRRLLLRIYQLVGAELEARWEGDTLLVDAPPEPTLDAAEIDRLLAFGAGLPAANILVVQRESARGAFPPLPRPVLTSVEIGVRDVALTSRAVRPADETAMVAPHQIALSRSALLAAGFQKPPAAINDLNRLFGGKVSGLMEDGGSLALYEIDTHKLVPRPAGVIAVPPTADSAATFNAFAGAMFPSFLSRDMSDTSHRTSHGVDIVSRQGLGYRVETARTPSDLLLAFDRSSIEAFITDDVERSATTSRWVVRIDPARLVPILQALGNNPGFRFAAPKLARSAQDLRGWAGYLTPASRIDGTLIDNGPYLELRASITSK
jgi:hypothetical protein